MPTRPEGRLATAGQSAQFSREDVFEALSNERRRYALHYLQWASGPVGLEELSRRVASWENDAPVDDLTAAEEKRVRTALAQFHLPRLEDDGFVRYDRDRRTVALTDDAAELRVYVDVVPAGDVPWAVVYLALAAVSGALVSAVGVGVEPFASLPDLSLSAFAVVSFGVAALSHTYVSARKRLGATRTPPEVGER